MTYLDDGCNNFSNDFVPPLSSTPVQQANMEFFMLDGGTGSGKTTALIDYAGGSALAGDIVVIAQPTTDLIDKTLTRARERWPDIPIRAIHSKNTEGGVANQVKDHTRDLTNGEALFVTHTALAQQIYVHDKDQVDLIIDELPTPFWEVQLSLDDRESFNWLPQLDVKPVDGKYSRVLPGDRARLERISANKFGGSLNAVIQEFATKLVSGDWEVYVITAQWERITKIGGKIRKNAKPKTSDETRLNVFALLKPETFFGYKSVTFVSANLTGSLLYQLFTQRGVKFTPHPRMTPRLKYKEHLNGEHLSIYYAIESDWSKKTRDKKINVDGNEASINEVIIACTSKLFGTEQFVKAYNLDHEKLNPFGSNGERLPAISHGRNDFAHIHNCVVLSALSPSPAGYAFLEQIGGVEPAKVKQAIFHEAAYQAVGRTSLRVLTDHTPKKVVVPDHKTALFLAKMYPRSVILRLPDVESMLTSEVTGKRAGRPPIERTSDTEIAHREQKTQAKRRERWKQKNVSPLILFYKQLIATHNRVPKGQKTAIFAKNAEQAIAVHETPRDLDLWMGQAGFHSTSWDSRAANPSRPYEYFEVQYYRHCKREDVWTTDEFFKELKRRSQISYDRKEHNDLFAPTAFDLRRDPEHGHSLKNAVGVKGLVADLDESMLTPEFIAKMVKYRMMIYSSWAYPETNNFRVVIPMTDYVTESASMALRMMFMKIFEDLGYTRGKDTLKPHGIDLSKLNWVSLFYYPCLRPNSFCTEFNQDCPPLDPYTWLENVPNEVIDYVLMKVKDPDLDPIPEPAPSTPANPQLKAPMSQATTPTTYPTGNVDAAIEYWRAHGCLKGQGHGQLFFFAKRLAQCGLPEHEMRQIMDEQCAFAHNPTERRSEINGVLKSDAIKAEMKF